jgi:DNA modification methylase
MKYEEGPPGPFLLRIFREGTMQIKEIKVNPKNPRIIKDARFQKLVKSIEEFPEMMKLRPIVVDADGMILGGNMRYKALQHLGFKEIPDEWVKRADELTEEQKKRFIIADNAPYGEWDWDILANEWDAPKLSDWGIDFPEDWMPKQEAQEDDYEVPDEIETDIALGDLFEIGPHRLLCGDSTDSEQVAKLMNGEKADICFTSPPYWVGFAYENENEKATILQHIYDESVNMALFVKGKIIINTGNISSITTAEKITGKKQPALLIDWWIDALNKNNYLLRHIRIWAKNGGVQPSRANDKIDMHWEYMGLFTDEDDNAGFISTFKNQNDKEGIAKNTPTWAVNGIWNDIQGKARASGHVAAFPVQLVSRYAQMYTKENHLFYEPYCGSGTTMVAAHQLNRKCYGMELVPKYCQVIIDRMRKLDPGITIKRNGELY